jgi:hypothetical protein
MNYGYRTLSSTIVKSPNLLPVTFIKLRVSPGTGRAPRTTLALARRVEAKAEKCPATSSPLLVAPSDVTVEGDFEWINGEPLDFSSWRPGQPDDFVGLEEGLIATSRTTDTSNNIAVPLITITAGPGSKADSITLYFTVVRSTRR